MPKLVELCLLYLYDIKIQQIITYNRKLMKGLASKWLKTSKGLERENVETSRYFSLLKLFDFALLPSGALNSYPLDDILTE